MPKKHPSFPTSDELKELIAERDKDLDRLELKYTPRWQLDINDEVYARARLRERKIRRQTTRLEKAARKLEQDFDWNS